MGPLLFSQSYIVHPQSQDTAHLFQTFSAGNFTFMCPFLITDIPTPASRCFYIDSVSNSFPLSRILWYLSFRISFEIVSGEQPIISETSLKLRCSLRPFWISYRSSYVKCCLFSFSVSGIQRFNLEDTFRLISHKTNLCFSGNKTRNSKFS